MRSQGRDENILDHRNDIPAGELSDRVIVEEAPGPNPNRIVWKLRLVYDDGTIAWNLPQLATIFRKRDYDRIWGP